MAPTGLSRDSTGLGPPDLGYYSELNPREYFCSSTRLLFSSAGGTASHPNAARKPSFGRFSLGLEACPSQSPADPLGSPSAALGAARFGQRARGRAEAAPETTATSIMSQQSQNKGGRPKKPEEERRSLTHGLRLSPNEKEELEARADRAGLSLSEYLRRKALGKPVKTKVDGKALKELNRIGVNLNQLARAANRGDILIGGQVREAIEELRSLIEEIDSQPADSQPADSQSAESQSDSKGSESNG